MAAGAVDVAMGVFMIVVSKRLLSALRVRSLP
jgi:hypothetical protein